MSKSPTYFAILRPEGWVDYFYVRVRKKDVIEAFAYDYFRVGAEAGTKQEIWAKYRKEGFSVCKVRLVRVK